jgi:hypothetical protein
MSSLGDAKSSCERRNDVIDVIDEAEGSRSTHLGRARYLIAAEAG